MNVTNTKGPLVAAIKKKSENGSSTVVARLYATPDGLAWNGEAPDHLRQAAEDEVRHRFAGVLHKLPLYEGVEFPYNIGYDFVSDGTLGARVAEKKYFDNYYGVAIEDITPEHIELVKERRFWNRHYLTLGEDVIQLEGTKRLVRHYGKYQSGLSILVERYQDYAWNPDPNLAAEMNVRFDGETFTMRGEYFVSKKGTKCFRIHKDGPHLLIKSEWGGAFRDTRGFASWRDDIPKDALYFCRARSNGGGMGNDYLVLPVGYRARLREEDVI